MVVKGLSPAAASSCFSSFFRVVFLFPLWAVWQPTLHLRSAFSRSDELWCLRSFPPEFFGNLNAWRNLCKNEKRVDRESWCIFSPFTQKNDMKGIATLCQFLSKFCYFMWEAEKLGIHYLTYKAQPAQHLQTVPQGSISVEVTRAQLMDFCPILLAANFRQSDWYRDAFFFLLSFVCLVGSIYLFSSRGLMMGL